MDEAGPNSWISLLVQKAHFCTDREKIEKKKEAARLGWGKEGQTNIQYTKLATSQGPK